MSGYSGSLLLSSKLSDFEPIGYEGEPVWKSASQINQILLGRLSVDHAFVFATPVVDETDNRIDWFAASNGSCQRWNTLDVDTQTRIAHLIESYVADIETLSTNLIESDTSDAVMLGDRLRCACYAASATDVFVVDDRPVVANWSLRSRNHPSAPSVLPILSTLIAEPVTPQEPMEASANEPRATKLTLFFKLFLPLILILVMLIYWLGWCDRFTSETTQRGSTPQTEESTGEVLKLPEEALKFGDLSFLEGRWRSISDLKNTRTNEPIVAEYTFDREGRGTKQVIEKDQVCETRVDAGIIGERLHLRDKSHAKCPDGGKYVPAETICEPGKGQTAECKVSQEGHDSIVTVIIRRLKGSN